MNISFLEGEVKEITAKITPINPMETLVVSSAEYQLFDCKKNIVTEGSCEVSSDEITVLLGIDKVGQYTLKITVQIGRETIIEKASIFVGG